MNDKNNYNNGNYNETLKNNRKAQHHSGPINTLEIVEVEVVDTVDCNNTL